MFRSLCIAPVRFIIKMKHGAPPPRNGHYSTIFKGDIFQITLVIPVFFMFTRSHIAWRPGFPFQPRKTIFYLKTKQNRTSHILFYFSTVCVVWAFWYFPWLYILFSFLIDFSMKKILSPILFLSCIVICTLHFSLLSKNSCWSENWLKVCHH